MKVLLTVLVLIQVYIIVCYEQPSKISNIIYSKKHNPECKKRLDLFSDYHKNFIQCAIEYGQPIKICEVCLQKFVVSNMYYKNLTENYNGTNCYDHFIDQDRINIVSSINNDGINIWNKAYCKDCYDWHDDTIKLNYSMETKTFLNLLNTTMKCIQSYWGEDVCGYCMEHYTLLNNLFISMEKQKKSQICFDLQDSMNQTRLLWSKELKCCDERESSLLIFTILSTGFSCMIIFFYVAIPYIEIRNEMQTLVTNGSTEENTQSGSSNDSNVEDYGNIITGFVMPSAFTNKSKPIYDDDEDSSDSEMLSTDPKMTDDNLIEIDDDEQAPRSKN